MYNISMVIDIDGLNINYKITGQGEDTVVILQGWAAPLSVYDLVASCISDRYRVVQFDFPGFGASEEPPEPWGVDGFTDFFIHFMERLQIQKATLIGHSYGGRVIIKLFTRDSLPFQITNIVLIDSAGIMPVRSAAQKASIRRYKLLKKFADNSLIKTLFPDIVEDWKSRQGSADYRNASPIMRQCLVKSVNEDLTDILPRVSPEVLLIWGEKDTATPLSDGQKMEELMPNAGLAVIPAVGHYPFAENYPVFRSIMQSYFSAGGDQ